MRSFLDSLAWPVPACAKLREIGRLARIDIEKMLGKHVHLQVWVRVRRGWSDDVKALKTLGYD